MKDYRKLWIRLKEKLRKAEREAHEDELYDEEEVYAVVRLTMEGMEEEED